MDYKKVGLEVFDAVGGNENVAVVTHCATRLRFELKDRSRVNEEKLNQINGVLKSLEANGQFQVVIGPNVTTAYQAIQTAFTGNSEVVKGSAGDNRTLAAKFLAVISGIFTPVIPAITGAGMVKAVLAILNVLHLIDTSGQTYAILNFSADAAFFFMPFLLAASSAKIFQMSSGLAMMLHEPLTKGKAAGIALALAGVYVILGGGGANSPVGIGLSLFSVLFWSLVSVLMRRVTQKYDAISVTRYGVGIAALCYLPVCLWEIAETGGIHLDAPGILALLYMGVVCTGGAYYLWNKSLSLLDASTCSAFYPVQPLVSAGLGMLFLGEKTGLGFWIGALLIVAGIFVNLFGNGLLHT